MVAQARIWTAAGTLALFVLVGAIFWISYGRLIDARLAGEQRPMPRIFGRAFELRSGVGLSPTQLAQRLDELGYAERAKAEQPGEFARASPTSIVFIPRPVSQEAARAVRADFSRVANPTVTKLTDAAGKPVDHVTLEAPLLAALAPGEKRRYMPLAGIPQRMIARGHRDRGSPLLRASRRRSDRRDRRARHQSARRASRIWSAAAR